MSNMLGGYNMNFWVKSKYDTLWGARNGLFIAAIPNKNKKKKQKKNITGNVRIVSKWMCDLKWQEGSCEYSE
jgi:hypothetical protein